MSVLQARLAAALSFGLACAPLLGCGEPQAHAPLADFGGDIDETQHSALRSGDPSGNRAALQAGTLALSVRLLATLATSNGHNVLFSPYGITRTLGLLQSGAHGRTAAQLGAAVAGEMALGPLLEAHAASRDALAAEAKRFKAHTQLVQADAVWGAPGLAPGPDFGAALATAFGDAWHTVDFADSPRRARQAINRWVCEQTQGQVPDLLGQGMPHVATRLLLTSTLYVSAPWARPFPAAQVRPAAFTNADGHAHHVPTLFGQVRAKYGVADGWVAVDLPYRATGLSLTLMWPQSGSLAEAQKQLSGAAVQRIWQALAPQTVALSLPKFKLDACHGIKEALTALGVVDVFSPDEADLGGIDAGPSRVHVDALLHRARLEVNERGTQAAAATGIVLRPTSVPEHIEAVTVDHPFLFFMRDSAAMTVLFAGRVATLAER